MILQEEKLLHLLTRSEKKVHLGDVIQVEGAFDHQKVFLAQNYQIIQTWQENHPQESFQPIPPIKPNCTKKIGICKFWANTGKCPNGEKCIYQHIKSEYEKIM